MMFAPRRLPEWTRRALLLIAAVLLAILPTHAQAEDGKAVKPAATLIQPVDEPEYVPVGDVQIAEIGNIGAVVNGPTRAVVIKTPEPIYIRSIQTYHWNGGRGRTPGTISLRNRQGEIFGPWPTVGKPGQGGVANAYWYGEPDFMLPAGEYELVDSDPKSWATNKAAGNRGFVRIAFQNVKAAAGGAQASAIAPQPQTAGRPADGMGGDKAAATAEPVLFDGAPDTRWRPVSAAGGNFDAFARYAGGMLVVEVPEGNGWAKTGIRSTAPLIKPGERTAATTLRFVLAAEKTTSFVLALAARDGEDEWYVHDVHFGWSQDADGSGGQATLYWRGGLAQQARTGARAPETVEFRLDPSGALAVILPGGPWLETRIAGGIPKGGYYIHAIAHAPAAGKAARLALRRIEREEGPAMAPASKAYPDPRREVALFDGQLGAVWLPYSAAGGDFNRHARLDGKTLVVDVPAGNIWGNVGILSPAPVVWLDALEGGGEAEVTFAIDPDRSDGFALALAHPGYGGVGGNPPGNPSVNFSWYRPKGSSGAFADVHFHPHGEGAFDRQEVAARPPAEVHFTVRPGEVTVAAEGMTPVTHPFPVAQDGAGLRVYAYSIVPEVNAPTRFVLRRITLHRRAGAAASQPAPAPGVEPLPAREVFAGAPSPAWEPIGVAGGNFDAFARYGGGALAINVPAGNSWGKTGLLSAEPLVRLDERVRLTPTRIELRLDPAVPENLNVALSGKKIADMWLSHLAWYSFTYDGERGVWVMGIRLSPYQEWSRDIDAGWMAEHWDGRLRIDVGDGWTALAIPDGPKVYATAPAGPGYALFAVIQAHAPEEGKAAQLTLKRVDVGLATPTGMDADSRWALLEPEDFDPNAFLSDLSDWMDEQ